MKILICGGRNFHDTSFMHKTLNALCGRYHFSELIEGGAHGADTYAGNWADFKQIPHKTFAADWKKYGKGAGPIRNQQMLDEGKPEMVVAFPGNRGTADMVNRAIKAKLQVIEIEYVFKFFNWQASEEETSSLLSLQT